MPMSTHQVNSNIKQHGQAICRQDKTSRKDEHPFSARLLRHFQKMSRLVGQDRSA